MLAVGWLVLVAILAFAVAAAIATPRGTPVKAWRQAPIAAVGSYALIVPLVRLGAGQLPLLQLALTTTTAIVIGALVGIGRTTWFEAREAGR